MRPLIVIEGYEPIITNCKKKTKLEAIVITSLILVLMFVFGAFLYGYINVWVLFGLWIAVTIVLGLAIYLFDDYHRELKEMPFKIKLYDSYLIVKRKYYDANREYLHTLDYKVPYNNNLVIRAYDENKYLRIEGDITYFHTKKLVKGKDEIVSKEDCDSIEIEIEQTMLMQILYELNDNTDIKIELPKDVADY